MPASPSPASPSPSRRPRAPRWALPALVALAVGAVVPNAAAATPEPASGQVLRTVEVALHGEDTAWTGTISFGLITSGPVGGRVVRPVPVTVDLTRTQCDMAGCVSTSIQSAPGMASPSLARVARGLTSAALDPSAIAVTVRRTSGGAVIGEYLAVLPVAVKARRAGEMTRVTDLIQGPDGERFTVTERMPMRAWVTLAGDTMEAVAVASRARTVVGAAG